MREQRRSSLLPVVITLIVLTMLLGTTDARAHTSLVSSTPPAGTRLDALDAITLQFDAPVDVTRLHVWLEHDGTVIPLAGATHAIDDPATVRVALPPIGTGDYALGWHLIAADGDAVTGAVPFALGEPAASVTAAPTPQSTAVVVDTAPARARRTSAWPVGGLLALSAGLTIALARRSTRGVIGPLAAIGLAASLGVAVLGGLLPVVEVAAWTAALAVVFAVAHPASIHRLKEHVA